MTLFSQFRADGFVLLRSRTFLIAVAAIVVAAALVTLGLVLSYGTADQVADLTTSWGQGEVLIDPLTGLFLAGVIASFWGSAHRDGTILWHFFAARKRSHVVVAALLITAGVGIVVGVLAMAAKSLTLQTMLPPGTAARWWESDHGLWAVTGGIFATVCLSVTAGCVAFLFRHGAAAIGVMFGWVLLVEPFLVSMLPLSWRVWFPGHALIAVRNHVEAVSTPTALCTAVGYVLLLVTVTVVVVKNRDPA